MSERLQTCQCNKPTTDSLVSSQSKLDKNRKPLVSQPPLIQTKLTINQPGDEHEQEADRVAEQVMRVPDSASVSQSQVNSRPEKLSIQSISRYPEKDIQRKEESDEEEGIVQMKQDSLSYSSGRQPGVPPIVHEVLSSPGIPVEPATRAYMEPRFGHDFSRVRVHTDTKAVESARKVNAHAYTVGQNVVFGENRYLPGTDTGRRLIAHELTHVVQQSYLTARLQRAPEHYGQETNFRCPAADSCNRVTMKNKVPTWAGEFIVDKYCSSQTEGAENNGVYLEMRFKPNENVDAEKIAFVQTANSKSGGKPIIFNESTLSEEEKKTSRERMIPTGPSEGTHIDQTPAARTPLYGMSDVSGKSGLAEFDLSTHPHLSEPGYHYRDSAGTLRRSDALMHDCPMLKRTGQVAQEQIFETAALAVSGVQEGIFYGSVKWGWKMELNDNELKVLPVEVVSKNAPSPEFAEATKLWNKTLTSEGKATISVPDSIFTVKTATVLWEDHNKRKKIDTLAKGSRVGILRLDISSSDFLDVLSQFLHLGRIVVVSGKLAGKVGWVKLTDIDPIHP